MRVGFVAVLLLAWAAEAGAAEIKVLTTGAYKPVIEELVPAFERETGHKVVVQNDTAGAVVRRINGGEAFDVLVLTPAGFADLAKRGRVFAESPRELARVGIGVAVRAGAPKPDISTAEAFKTALLSARSVAMIDPAAGGSSGLYLAQLFARWGIADQIKAKAVLVPGGLVASRVVSGEADVAIHQISEILAVKEAVLVGPLPEEVQNYTTYSGTISAAPSDLTAAQAFLGALTGPGAGRVLAAKGMMPAGF
ncbi:MAG TPA: substrate-binding domain-containing protein [Salinarimonas sp.]|nr:substrate-binding domain-containing protein [Salinarimonas sp.]